MDYLCLKGIELQFYIWCIYLCQNIGGQIEIGQEIVGQIFGVDWFDCQVEVWCVCCGLFQVFDQNFVCGGVCGIVGYDMYVLYVQCGCYLYGVVEIVVELGLVFGLCCEFFWFVCLVWWWCVYQYEVQF